MIDTSAEVLRHIDIENISQEDLFDLLIKSAEEFLGSASLIFTYLLYFIITLIIVYYLLKDDHLIKKWAEDNIFNEIQYSEEYLKRIDKELESIYFGNMITVFIISFLAVSVFISYNIISPEYINIKYTFLLTLLCGISSLVPIIGIKIIYIPLFSYLSLIAYSINVTSLSFPIFYLIISMILIDIIPETFIRPYISNRNMHLGLVIISYLTGVILFGWYGLFFGPFVLTVIYYYIITVSEKNINL